MRTALVIALFALGLALWSGCATPTGAPDIPLGTYCKVRLRRDALGIANDRGVDVHVDVAEQRRISINGVLVRKTRDYVVIREGPDDEAWDVWVPRHSILLIHSAEPTEAAQRRRRKD